MINSTSAALASIRQRYPRASMAADELERLDALALVALQRILDSSAHTASTTTGLGFRV
jgi:hypothetical protein